MKQYLFLLLSLAFLTCACNPVTPEPQLMTDVEGPVLIDKDGGSFTIQVKSNCTWKATAQMKTDSGFFSLSPDCGQADGIIRLSAWKNVMNYKKLGVIEIEYGNGEETRLSFIQVVQEPREPMAVFMFEESETVPYYGGAVSVPFSFNTLDYRVGVAPSEQSDSVQINIREDSNIEQEVYSGTVAAEIPSNTSSESRTFTLQLTDKQRTTVFDTFVIHQAGRQK